MIMKVLLVYRTSSNPLEIGNIGSKVKVTVTENVWLNDKKKFSKNSNVDSFKIKSHHSKIAVMTSNIGSVPNFGGWKIMRFINILHSFFGQTARSETCIWKYTNESHIYHPPKLGIEPMLDVITAFPYCHFDT